ncbi:hypothetical protein T265_11846 [Opisthorchis viverrini]|uniref:Lipase maturation factor n=1 Tax=Opisthorchis viverrini TaxID=6198 RepID=A0A074YXH2_OPIVI|nr:hypothetical protein T265_11846 [Opisthorchis viverrini]KER19358.1 hypothetical protein T265_11846 [Opisthorchis viverrini]
MLLSGGMCIPNPVAWHAHHLPGWMHNFSVASTLIIEILLPLLFFVPLRLIRLFSFYSQLLLQGLIILTGNFNFFNLLTMALCYSLLKDEDFNIRRRKTTGISSTLSNLLSLIIIGTVLAVGGYLFNFRVTPGYTIASSVGFTKTQFNHFLTHAVSYIIYAAVALFAIQVYCSLVCALKAPKLWRNCVELAGVVVVGIIGLTLLFSSFVPFGNLDGQSVEKLPISVRHIHSQLRPYHLTNGYGLFRRMTGVGGRPEVILEGAPSMEGPWTEYHFRFKPGRVNRTPPVVIPHQPRVDWQLWFAALSQPDDHPWFYNLVYRLLQQEPDVLQLLDTSTIPTNPKFVRAHLYTYYYTQPTEHLWRQSGASLNLKGRVYQATVRAVLLYGCETWPVGAAELKLLQVFDNRCLRNVARVGGCRRMRNETVRNRSGNWWHRVRKSDYLPPVSLSSPVLRMKLEESGLIGRRITRKWAVYAQSGIIHFDNVTNNRLANADGRLENRVHHWDTLEHARQKLSSNAEWLAREYEMHMSYQCDRREILESDDYVLDVVCRLTTYACSLVLRHLRP